MVPSMIDELCRVLQPGGRLVLGTPDYDRWEWVWMEKAYGLAAPGGYADEHISHYTRKGLLDEFARRGYTHEATRYILRGELILAFRKPVATAPVRLHETSWRAEDGRAESSSSAAGDVPTRHPVHAASQTRPRVAPGASAGRE